MAPNPGANRALCVTLHAMPTLHCLSFDLSLDTDGVHTFDAQAAAPIDTTSGATNTTLAAVRDEVRQVLAWAETHFPDGPGPLDEGCSWCHDLQDQADGDWHSVSLSLSGTAAFGEAFAQAFAGALTQSPGG